MAESNPDRPNRRDFLSGKAARERIERAGNRLADEIVGAADQLKAVPVAGDTIRLSTDAMACTFSVIMNPGPSRQVMTASDALDLIHHLEDQLSVYRPHTELSLLNQRAGSEAVEVEPRLFRLLQESVRIAAETGGAFDPTSGPLIALWRRCRDEGTVPTDDQIAAILRQTGWQHVRFNDSSYSIEYQQDGLELNLGGIGKGYALDRAAEHLDSEELSSYLLHGGYSSIFARGQHRELGGWPVGIRNPLFTNTRMATILLRDQALSSSGSSVQHFRHRGKKYGHILDPRTGWPAEGLLSVTVVAPTAALADALSTAFFVMGVEKAREYCDNREGVGALLVPPPRTGRKLDPILCGISEDQLFFLPDQIPSGAPDR